MQALQAAADGGPYDSELPGVAVASATDRVRLFYDRHPYPPPVSSLDRYRQLWLDPDRRRADYHLLWPEAAYRTDLEILIAGCGTAQAAKHALRQPEARVIGIDVSATSIEHTQALQRKYNLPNLEIRQLAVERCGLTLGRWIRQAPYLALC